jgi:hypothetical protein
MFDRLAGQRAHIVFLEPKGPLWLTSFSWLNVSGVETTFRPPPRSGGSGSACCCSLA